MNGLIMAGEDVKQWICKSLEKNAKVWLASPLVRPVIEPPGHVGVTYSLSTAASPVVCCQPWGVF